MLHLKTLQHATEGGHGEPAYYVVASAGVTLGASLVIRSLYGSQIKQAMAKKKDEYVTKCKKGIDELRLKKMSEEEVEKITSRSLPQLVAELEKGQVAPLDLLTAYQIKAYSVNHHTNSITEVIAEAESWARENSHKKERRSAIDGIPVSIKENYVVGGYHYHRGTVKPLFRIPPEDCVLVKVLKQQGAIPFVRTNGAQLGLSLESGSPLFGDTCNPHDASRNPGGSSGGEGALVGGGGSILGWGSDIGGSIRNPAFNSGCAGIKPTQERLSSKGVPGVRGQTVVSVTYGPLSRDVDSLVLAMKSVLVPAMFELDPSVPNIPFRDEVYLDRSKLRIGFYDEDGVIQSTPAVKRAVQMAKEALQRQGHELVYWRPENLEKGMEFWARAIAGDAGRSFNNSIRCEDVDECVVFLSWLLNIPRGWRWVLKKYYSFTGQRQMAALVDAFSPTPSVYDWWQLTAQVEAYRHSVMDSWQKAGLDVVITTAMPFAAPKRGTSDMSARADTNLMAYNVLNFACGVIPVTKVSREDIEHLRDYEPKDDCEAFAKQDQASAEGMPVGVQFITLPWRDELCLRAMKEAETALKEIK